MSLVLEIINYLCYDDSNIKLIRKRLKQMKPKDCVLLFSDSTPPYQFSSDDIGLALKTAKERGWRVLAIKTPDYALSIMTHEMFDNAVSEANFNQIVVE